MSGIWNGVTHIHECPECDSKYPCQEVCTVRVRVCPACERRAGAITEGLRTDLAE